jgi:hypothetical protein
VWAWALIRVEGVAGAGPSVSDEIGLCVHCIEGGRKVVSRERFGGWKVGR